MAGDPPSTSMATQKSSVVDDSLTNLNWLSSLNVTRAHISSSSSSSLSSTVALSSSSSTSSNSRNDRKSKHHKLDAQLGMEKIAKEKDLVNEIINRSISGFSSAPTGGKENIKSHLTPHKRSNFVDYSSRNKTLSEESNLSHSFQSSKLDSIPSEVSEPNPKRVKLSSRKNIFIEIVKDQMPFLADETSKPKRSSNVKNRDARFLPPPLPIQKSQGHLSAKSPSSAPVPSAADSLTLASITSFTTPSFNSLCESQQSPSSYDFSVPSLFDDESFPVNDLNFCNNININSIINNSQVDLSADFLRASDCYSTFPDESPVVSSSEASNRISASLLGNRNSEIQIPRKFLVQDELLEHLEGAEINPNIGTQGPITSDIANQDYNLDDYSLPYEFVTTSGRQRGVESTKMVPQYSSLDLTVQGTALRFSDSAREPLTMTGDCHDQMSPLDYTIDGPFDSDIGFDLRFNSQPIDDLTTFEMNLSWINEQC